MSREAHVRFCERAVAKFRRATRLLIFSERHLRRLLALYSSYYNQTRTPRLALGSDALLRRAVQESATIIATAILFGFASPLRADMIFGKDKGIIQCCGGCR
jgi:hypothetical protein